MPHVREDHGFLIATHSKQTPTQKAPLVKRFLLSSLPTELYLELKWHHCKLFDKRLFESLQKKRQVVTTDSYSFKPFDDKKAIFVHIPKCAGVSVCRSLFGNLAGGHTTLSLYCNVFEPKKFLRYFKFAFVRNPWDRLVSAYHFLRRGGFCDDDRQWFKRELSGYNDFDDFVRHWVTEENVLKYRHFWPQSHYLVDRNNPGVTVDYIGFFENIDDDFHHVARILGVEAELPRSNESAHRDYKAYYSAETRRIVKLVYDEDINRFGYDFDNLEIPTRRS